jgi:hypothetical protein
MMYRITLSLIAIIILGSYLYFSKPNEVVIDEKGKVEGLVNKARALIQRDKFWKLQLKMANEIYNKDIEPHLASSNDMQELYRKMREVEKALDEKMRPLYTLEEQAGNNLRIQADSIVRAGKWRQVNEVDEAVRLKEIEKFKVIIPIIESKLHIVKPQPVPAL